MMMRMRRLHLAAAQAKVEAARSQKSKLARARKKVMNVFLTMPSCLFSILVMIIHMEFVSMQDTVCCSTLASQATSTCIVKKQAQVVMMTMMMTRMRLDVAAAQAKVEAARSQ